ncbi:mitochondrial protein [Infundibulicybe gibba]|nr:mitochondrial protein [Infundibulicybe gibba]
MLIQLASRSKPTQYFSRGFSSRLRFSTTAGPKPRSWRPFAAVSGAAALSLVTYTIGVAYPPPTLSLIFPRPAPAPPSDPDSPESLAYTSNLESELQSLPLLQKLRQNTDLGEWYEARPYKNFPEARRVNSLTAGALRGPGKLALPPLVRARKDESESIIFVHLGRGLCGHDGIVHGGLLATLLDETLARTAINNLPEKVGVTAKLSLDYRAPTRADQFVVIKTTLIETKGRKSVVSGRVEDLQGTLLVEANATFVQPKYAKMLNTAALKQAIGEPSDADVPVHLADGEKLRVQQG